MLQKPAEGMKSILLGNFISVSAALMLEAVGVIEMDRAAPRRLALPVTVFGELAAEGIKGIALAIVISVSAALMFEDVGVIEMDGAAPTRLAPPPLVMFGDRALVVVLSGLVEASLDWLNIANDDLTRRWKLGLKKIQARYAAGCWLCNTDPTVVLLVRSPAQQRCLFLNTRRSASFVSALLLHESSSDPLIYSSQVSVARW